MNLRYLLPIAVISILAACAGKKTETEHAHDATAQESQVQQDTIKKSIPKEEHAQVGTAHVMIKYHAPAVRGRTIWGGLVPYGDVWVTGAHSATSLEIDKDFLVNGVEIPAGKYAFFTIPNTETWTIIINKKWDQHLADEYDAKDDLVRLDVTPEQLQSVQERLKYTIVSEGEQRGNIQVSWEKIKVKLPFDLK